MIAYTPVKCNKYLATVSNLGGPLCLRQEGYLANGDSFCHLWVQCTDQTPHGCIDLLSSFHLETTQDHNRYEVAKQGLSH